MIAECCKEKGCENCGRFFEAPCELKERLISEFNALDIKDMEKVTSLNALRGSFVNLEYILPSGDTIKFWDDNRIYFGNLICKKDSDRCYGLTADENYLLLCECDDDGAFAQIIAYKKR